MSYDLDISDAGWDQTFLDLSSKMAEPFCTAWSLLRFRLIAPLDPEKFENYATKAKEVAARVFIVLSAIGAGLLIYAMPTLSFCSIGVLGIGSRFFRALGFALQKGGYTHVRGAAPEKVLDPKNPQLKVMNWNICGFAGGLSLDYGGLIHWSSRLDGIVKKIKEEDPDVLILEEVFDTALAEALIKQLNQEYAHFFIHLGPNSWGSVGGGMVISKCAVHHFSHTSFKTNSWTMNRGFATLELKASPEDSLPSARIISTHLTPGSKDSEERKNQTAQILGDLSQKTLSMPTILAGDLNIEREGKEGESLLPYFHHGYQGEKPTATNRFMAQWDNKTPEVGEETIDYISIFKNTPLPDGSRLPVVEHQVSFADCHLVEAFDDSSTTKTTLSDHHGISAVIQGLQKARRVFNQ